MTQRDATDERARSRTYALFSDIFLNGPMNRVGQIVTSLPEFSGSGMPEVEEERAAEFESLFGFNVFPYASTFLEPIGQIGGETSSLVRSIYGSGNIDFYPMDEVDHVATELAFLGRLSSERISAHDAKVPELDAVAIEFLDRHVLAWLPSFNAAVQSQESEFYSRVTQYTLDLVLDHRRFLGESARVAAGGSARSEREMLPPSRAVIDEPSTGLKEIAEYLTTPLWCGLFLSRADITGFSSRERLPRGFGGRRQMMENVLVSAVTYGAVGGVLDQISTQVSVWKSAWSEMGALNMDMLTDWSTQWLERLSATQEVLDRLKRESGILV